MPLMFSLPLIMTFINWIPESVHGVDLVLKMHLCGIWRPNLELVFIKELWKVNPRLYTCTIRMIDMIIDPYWRKFRSILFPTWPYVNKNSNHSNSCSSEYAHVSKVWIFARCYSMGRYVDALSTYLCSILYWFFELSYYWNLMKILIYNLLMLKPYDRLVYTILSSLM